jgi:hypothetical protein
MINIYQYPLDTVFMMLALLEEFDLSMEQSYNLLDKIRAKYDFTDIDHKALIDYAFDYL